jgi:S1-C subfamily serine protease
MIAIQRKHQRKIMARHLTTLIGLLRLLPLTTSVHLPTIATFSAAVILMTASANAQNTEAVAKIAQRITVHIEGATQGSGVLLKRDGNRYTVLTAWHVVSDQRPGEELAIYMPDGKQYQLERGSIQRLGNVDLALLTFSSSASYEVAQIGDVKSVKMGGEIFVAGFPVATSAFPIRILRFLDGRVIANAQVAIPNGYQLLYSNPTQAGMSGGAVLNGKGQLVAIHGQAETDAQLSEQSGVAVKTGTNQGVPISYYNLARSSGNTGGMESGINLAASTNARTADDYLAQAKQILGQKDREKEVIRLTTQALLRQ